VTLDNFLHAQSKRLVGREIESIEFGSFCVETETGHEVDIVYVKSLVLEGGEKYPYLLPSFEGPTVTL